MNSNCIICAKTQEYSSNTMKPFIDDIKDYEYGIKEERELHKFSSSIFVSVHLIFDSNLFITHGYMTFVGKKT